jgi:hypothetical protein
MIQDIDDSPELTTLERLVLDVVLAGDDPDLGLFRAQVALASVASRTPSGVGFMTKLRVPDDAPIPELGAALNLPVVYATHPQLTGGAEFLVQVKDQRINCIEAFCYEGMWPADESLFAISQR